MKRKRAGRWLTVLLAAALAMIGLSVTAFAATDAEPYVIGNSETVTLDDSTQDPYGTEHAVFYEFTPEKTSVMELNVNKSTEIWVGADIYRANDYDPDADDNEILAYANDSEEGRSTDQFLAQAGTNYYLKVYADEDTTATVSVKDKETAKIGSSLTIPAADQDDPDGETEYYGYYNVEPVDKDTAIQISLEAEEATLYLYEARNDLYDGEQIVAAYYDDEEPRAATLKEGTAYFLEVINYGSSPAKATFELNSIQKIEFNSSREPMIENDDGRIYSDYQIWDEETEEEVPGKPYFRYYYEDFVEGDTLTVTDIKGISKVYTFRYSEEDDGYVLICDADGDKQDPDEVDFYYDQNEEHWGVDKANLITIKYKGVETTYNVEIVPTSVDEVTFTPAGKYVVSEEDYDSEDGEFYLPYWKDGDRFTAKFKDGEEKTYVFNWDKDIWEQEGGDDTLDEGKVHARSDQKTTPWKKAIGSENPFYVVYQGVPSNVVMAVIARSVNNAKITLAKSTLTYTGKELKPSIKSVTYGKTKLAVNKDYRIDSSGHRGIGTYYFEIQGIGNYTDWNETYYKIVPKGTKILKPKAAEKKITVKWKKQAAKMMVGYDEVKKNVTGYQVQYSLKKNFKKAKTKNVNGFKKTSVKIKKLKAKKNYFVRVRTVMKYDGETYYSPWSKVKKVKTK